MSAKMMVVESDARVVALSKSLSETMSLVVILVGSLVLVGWTFDITIFKSLSPNLVSMKANTAISFVLSGIALWLLQTRRVNRAYGLRTAEVCALIVAAVGFLTMVEYGLGLDLGIDQLVFIEPRGTVLTTIPGRMAPTTAFNFFIIGIALLLLGERRNRLSQLIVLIEGFVAFLAVIGYMYGVTTLYGIPWATPMAIHTAVMFLLIAGSVLFAHPDEGIMSVWASSLPGGASARRLLLVLFTLVTGGGWVLLQGNRAGYYGTEYVASLLVVFVSTMLTSITWWNARSLNRAERVRVQAEETLQEMREQFLSHVTHELRTPLGPLKVHLDYAVAGKLGPTSRKLKSSLQVMKRSVDRLHGLTNELLDLRRIQAGKFQLTREPLNFLEILDQSIKETQAYLHDRRQGLHLEAPDKPLRIRGDPVRLAQVLVNLLNNASKFTPEAGNITIKVKDEANGIKSQVSDTGIGIRKDDLPKVFEPFSAIKKPQGITGTGLGLSITKGIVEAHGGKIWVESEGEGKGATFTFTLPKLKEDS